MMRMSAIRFHRLASARRDELRNEILSAFMSDSVECLNSDDIQAEMRNLDQLLAKIQPEPFKDLIIELVTAFDEKR